MIEIGTAGWLGGGVVGCGTAGTPLGRWLATGLAVGTASDDARPARERARHSPAAPAAKITAAAAKTINARLVLLLLLFADLPAGYGKKLSPTAAAVRPARCVRSRCASLSASLMRLTASVLRAAGPRMVSLSNRAAWPAVRRANRRRSNRRSLRRARRKRRIPSAHRAQAGDLPPTPNQRRHRIRCT